jgi:ribulose-5-phosphate 4-epimerase/fuculose-1-phosphate aldolase
MSKLSNNHKKKNLVNFFKILYQNNIGDLTANHASILSNEKNSFFINKHEFLFSQVNIDNLQEVKINEQFSSKYKKINKAGFFIHQYIHQSISKPEAILHTHSINAVAIASLRCGFNEKLNQSSMRFYKRVKYFGYSGMVMHEKEGKTLASIVKENTKLIILKNHGIIILANSIEELFHLTFHFEKCAEIQLRLANLKINTVSNKVANLTCKQHEQFGRVGEMSWKASIKDLKN